jgi:Tfp pilus assembly protein PilN
MARALRLDFLTERPRTASTGLVALFAGLAALAAVGVEYRAVAAETAALETRIADFRRMARRELPPIREAAMDSKLLAQEIRQANLVLAQLNLPWDALFRELEGAAMEGITLLAIQPEVGAGQVRIAGEAKTYETALAYVARLEASERFSNVFLTSHEVRASAPQRPVVFGLVADWSAQ